MTHPELITIGLYSSDDTGSWNCERAYSLHPGYLTSLVMRTNHNTIQTIGIYVRVFRTADHAEQIFIPHRISRGAGDAAETGLPKMSQARGLPLICYIKVVCILILSLGIILVFECS